MTRLSVVLIILALTLVFGSYVFRQQYEQTPKFIVKKYFEDLDFRRFPEAYEAISKESGITRERYIKGLTFDGGLLMSYAKLIKLNVDLVRKEKDRAVVAVDFDWVTALGRYENSDEFILVKENGQWKILWKEPVIFDIPEDMIEGKKVAWLEVARDSVVDHEAPLKDMLNKPQIEILDKKIVVTDTLMPGTVSSTAFNISGQFPTKEFREQMIQESKKQIYIIGKIKNVSAYPADVSISAMVFNKAGKKLWQDNCMDKMIHRLFPFEETPFRIDLGHIEENIADFMSR
ncbi:hypothetical protein KKC59_01065 [bacterium]|nr:hypothetical protein [bacterium]